VNRSDIISKNQEYLVEMYLAGSARRPMKYGEIGSGGKVEPEWQTSGTVVEDSILDSRIKKSWVPESGLAPPS
jgi:hypothetical protein